MSKEETKLKPCPCGETPNSICIPLSHEDLKWVSCSGNCCGEWAIEFRNIGYNKLDSPEIMKLAIEAWNNAPRGDLK